MSRFSEYLGTKILDFLFRDQVFDPPATLYVSLHTSNPTAAGLLSTEVVGNAYQRVAISITSSGVFAAPPVNRIIKNTATTIQFPTPTADWGIITHSALWDAVSGGNMWLYNALVEPLPALLGDDVEFPVNNLLIMAE